MTGLLLLATALATILISPLMLRFARANRWLPFLDGFALVGVGGIAALHLLPEAFEFGGLISGAFFLLGLFLPSLGEKFAQRRTHRSAIILVTCGILPHMLLESAALGAAPESKLVVLGAAIVAHRLPVALFVFSMIGNAYSLKRAWHVMFLLAVATLVGYWLGDRIMVDMHQSGLAWLQALVGGTLLHVIFAHDLKRKHASRRKFQLPEAESTGHGHNHKADTPEHHGHGHVHHHHDHKASTQDHHGHGHGHSGTQPAWLQIHDHDHGSGDGTNRWATLGAFFGALLVSSFMLLPTEHEHNATHEGFGDTFLALSLETAPILFLAYILAGLLRSLITPTQLEWLSRGGASLRALKGVTFGLPLPICSCGVLPIYETLVRRGVPASAAIGFLVATPELGLDAILLSIPLLGWKLTGARLVAAFTVAFLVAIFVGRKLATKHTQESAGQPPPVQPIAQRIKEGIHFGLVELFDHTFPWVLAGLLVAAWIEPMLNNTLFDGIPSYLQVPLFAVIGIPIYVCASGSTPLAAIAIHKGVSPGAAIAFLIAGPATNITTFGIMSKLHGKKTAVAFGLAVALGAIGAGLLVDYFAIQAVVHLHEHVHESSDYIGWFGIICMTVLFLISLTRQGPRGAMSQITSPIDL
jgi:uncharacterized protein